MTDKDKLAELMAKQVAGHYGPEYCACPYDDAQKKSLFKIGYTDYYTETQEDHRNAMIDAIDAITSAGYAIVKRVPDDEMFKDKDHRDICVYKSNYRAMVKQGEIK